MRDRRRKFVPAPNAPYNLTPADQKRFWAHVDMLGDHWWWVGPYPIGYPSMPLDSGEDANAARVGLQLVGRPLPPGYNVRYLCMDKQCINPDHNSIYNRRSGPWSYQGRPQHPEPRRSTYDPNKPGE